MKKYIYTLILLIISCSKIIAQNADVIFINANIITAAEKGARGNSMALEAGKIVYVGDVKSTIKFKNAQTKIIDLKGKTIIPGFNDVHLHPSPETNFNELDHIIKIEKSKN